MQTSNAMPQPVTEGTLSVEQLAELSRTLTPHELAQIPLSQLPSYIPSELLRKAPDANRIVLHDLMVELEARRTHEHVEDLHCFGKEVATAFQKAESNSTPKRGNVVGEHLHELAHMLHDWRKKRAALDAQRNNEMFRTLNQRFGDIREEVLELRDEVAEFNQAEYVLSRKAPEAGAKRERVSNAITQLREKTSPARARISQYYFLRMSVCYQEMKGLKAKIERAQAEQQELALQIESLRNELDARQSMWRKALRRYRASDDFGDIQKQITRLVAEQRAREVIVPEESLQRWLDAVVDASLDRAAAKLAAKLLPTVRSILYWLLSQYCQQQESSARQIARNPFVQINAEEAIQFLLLSEQFLLDYFVRRREENPFWFTSAVEERRDALDEMMNSLLRELKRNIKAFGDITV